MSRVEPAPDPAVLGDIEQFLQSALAELTPDPAEAARPGPGRPRVLPSLCLWAGLLVCVLRGLGSYQALWRLLSQRQLWFYPRFPVSDQMKTTERFTRLNNDLMLYEIKTEDPVILTRSWTARYPLKNDPTYDWWEYACHEGNRTIGDYIHTSRAERAQQGSK